MYIRFGLRVCAAMFALVMISAASSASAHVTVSSPDAEAGGFGKVIFRVPTESDTASTTSVSVKLPEKTPFAFISSQAKPGWTVKLTEVAHTKPVKVGEFNLTKTVSAVTWTAKGAGIKPGEFDEFALSVGPIPQVKSLPFTATQDYSDGTVVSWDEIPTGSKEPDHPAPTLSLVKPATGPPTTSSNADDSARWLALGAILIGAGGLIAGLRKNRRNV